MTETDADNFRILVVDDNPTNLKLLLQVLETESHSVMVATSGAAALRIAAQAIPDLILLDVVMPEMDGYEVCRHLQANAATDRIPVIFLTGRDGKEDVMAGFAAGGVDYVVKPFREEEVLARVATHVKLHRLSLALEAKNIELEAEIARRKELGGQLSMISRRDAERWGLHSLIGDSETMRAIFAEVELLQDNPGTSVLITGESGTGKELIARAIHYGCDRRDGPFVPVNCSAIPADLVESALFGHVRGAFTGATDDRLGYFEMARGGTLFLDEIADMPLTLQSKLLRVLEDGEVWPVGATQSRHADVRVLAATNVGLEARMTDGGFRQDLFYRLARYRVVAPPLRDRRDDILLLADHFLRQLSEEMGRDAVAALTEPARQRLAAHDYPGNVRELKNIVERGLIESRGADVDEVHLRFPTAVGDGTASVPAEAAVLDEPLDLDEAVHQAETRVLQRALARCNGNLTGAARLLGTTRNRLYRVQRREG
jgi:DNA-binding NtrC family response regulator